MDLSFISNNPYISAGCGAAACLGIGAIGYRLTNSSDELNRQQRTKAVLDKMLITEYHLPSKAEEKKDWSLTNHPKPVFDNKTKKEVDIVAKMIEKAVHHQSPLPNLILKGPAGVGKTMLGEDLCRQTGIGFIRIPSGAMEKHIKTGNHITAFRDVIKIAEECPAPTYIIMDDGEELIAQRPETQKTNTADNLATPWMVEQERLSQTIAQRRTALVNAILEESGKSYRKIGFCITTNRPDVIDSAFGTRSRIIAIEGPNTEERKQIIITHLPTVFKFDNDMLSFFNKGRLEDMANKTEGFTGRNIVKMLEDIYACVQLENGNITQDIVDASIIAMKASVAKAHPQKGPTVLDSVRQLAKSILFAIAS